MATNPLLNSLAQGQAAIGGAGVNPTQLYGGPLPAPMPPAMGPPSSLAGPAPAAPGASPASLYGIPGPVSQGVSQGTTTSAPTGMPGVQGGAETSNPPATGIGPNSFGVHPNVDLHGMTDYLLPQVRGVESSNNYAADRAKTHPGQTASGAYQYIDSTWNGYGGYKRAVDAPPQVQDQRAKQDLMDSLTKFGGDPFKAVAAHYFPKYASDPTKWNQPLVDGHGKQIPNSQTVAGYVGSVLSPQRVSQYLASQQQQSQQQQPDGSGGSSTASL